MDFEQELARRIEKEQKNSAGEAASLNLLVAIYLLLLAFFIVLNSISNQKVARAGAVLESVNSSFDKQFAPPAQVVDFLRKPTAIAPNEEFVEDAVGLMASVISIEGGYHTEGGDTVLFKVPLSSLFPEGGSTPRDDLSPFVGQLASLVTASKLGERREIEFVFGSGEETLTSQPVQKQFLAARRASNLANALVDLGLPSNRVSTGVMAGPADVIVVRFMTRNEDAVAVTFSAYGQDES